MAVASFLPKLKGTPMREDALNVLKVTHAQEKKEAQKMKTVLAAATKTKMSYGAVSAQATVVVRR